MAPKSRIGSTIFYLIFTREINPSFQPVLFVETRLPRGETVQNYALNDTPWHASLSKKLTKLGHRGLSPRLSNRSFTMLKHHQNSDHSIFEFRLAAYSLSSPILHPFALFLLNADPVCAQFF